MNPAWERVIKGHLARVVSILAQMVRPNEFFSCTIIKYSKYATGAENGQRREKKGEHHEKTDRFVSLPVPDGRH